MLAATSSDDPASWRAAEMRQSTAWQLELSADQQDEVRRAADASRVRAIAAIERGNFALPTLGPVLEAARREVVDGRGFVLIRGLPIADMDRETVVRAYVGIGAHFGVARPQNRAGHLVGHVTDLGDDQADPKTRLYRTNARQRFHVDSCDVVGLLCLAPARSGGASALSSSIAIYEEILRTRPDLAAVLAEPFVHDRKDEVPPGKGPHYPMPIVHHHAGRTSVYFARDFIEAAEARFADVPRLSAAQRKALDLVEHLAESDAFRLDMDFHPGDMQFVHNHVILHARTAYQDWPEPGRRRHLLRLWLSAHDPRPLPPAFEERYGPIRPGQPRGGIVVESYVPRVPLQPE